MKLCNSVCINLKPGSADRSRISERNSISMLLQSIKMAWSSVISNKMRSFLTMLGIIIGVVALVVLVSIVNGATSDVTDTISAIGTNMLSVTVTDDKENPLSLSEMEDILEVDYIAAAAPIASDSLTASYGDESESVSVTGTTGDYMEIEEGLASGRWLRQSDSGQPHTGHGHQSGPGERCARRVEYRGCESG